jgi:hypothetical protein
MGDLDGAGGGGKDEVGVIGYPKPVQVAKSCYHTMGISFRGEDKGFMDFLMLIDEGFLLLSLKGVERLRI